MTGPDRDLTDKSIPYRGLSVRATYEVDSYREIIKNLRRTYLGVVGPTGRRSKGPRYFAIVRCQGEECGNIGMTSSKATAKNRWACKTCGETTLPIWADGPTPDDDEIYELYMKHRK